MAANDQYLSFWGPNGLKELGDAKQMLTELTRMIVEFNEVSAKAELKVVSAKTYSETAKAAEELKAAQNGLAASTKELDAMAARLAASEAKAAQQMEQLSKEVADLKKKCDELSGARKKQKTDADEITRLEERLAKANTDEAKTIAALREELRLKNLENKRSVQAMEAEEGSLTQLRAQLALVTAQYDAMGKASRESDSGKALLGNIQTLHTEVSALEQGTGRFGRNVGNYSTAVNGLRSNLLQVARELPSLANGFGTFAMAIGNNLPQVGDSMKAVREENAKLRAEGKPTQSVFRTMVKSIVSWQTALLVLLTLLPKIGEAIGDWINSVSDAEKQLQAAQKARADASKEAARETASVIASVSKVRQVFKEAKEGVVSKKDALDIYNNTLGDSIGKADTLAEAEASLNAKADTFIQYTYRKALAQAAFAKSAQLSVDAFLLQNQSTDETLSGFDKVAVKVEGWVGSQSTLNDKIRDNKKAVKEMLSTSGNLQKFAQEQQRAADALAKSIGVDITGNKEIKPKKEPKPTDLTNETVNNQERIAKATAEAAAQRREANMQANRAIFEDERNFYTQRILAYQVYSAQRLLQIGEQRAGELNAIDANLNKIAEIERKAVGSRTKEEKKLLEERGALEAERAAVVEKYKAEEATATREIATGTTAILKSEYDKRARALADGLATEKIELQSAEDEKRLAIARSFLNGKLDQEQYRQSLEDLNREYDRKELLSSLDAIEKQIAAAKSANIEVADLEKEAAEIRRQLREQEIEEEENVIEKVKALREDLKRRLIELAREVYDTLLTFVDARFEKEKERVDEEGELAERDTRLEIERIERSALSEEEKEDRITEAKARAADAEEDRQKKLQDIEERRQNAARDGRASEIAGEAIVTGVKLALQAAELTAKAAAQAATLNPQAVFTATAATLTYAQAGVVAALAAAQIAALYAYAEGTPPEGHPVDGPAMVGDAYQHEVIRKKDGRLYLTPARPTIVHLQKGDDVFPSVQEYINHAGLTNNIQMPVVQPAPAFSNKEVVDALYRTSGRIIAAQYATAKRNRQPHYSQAFNKYLDYHVRS